MSDEILWNLLSVLPTCKHAGCSRVATHSALVNGGVPPFQVCTDHLKPHSSPSYINEELWAIWDAEAAAGRFGIRPTRKQWESVGLQPRTPPGDMPIQDGTVVYLPDDKQLAIVTAVKPGGEGQFTKFRLVADDGKIYDVAGVPMIAIATVDIKLKTK